MKLCPGFTHPNVVRLWGFPEKPTNSSQPVNHLLFRIYPYKHCRSKLRCLQLGCVLVSLESRAGGADEAQQRAVERSRAAKEFCSWPQALLAQADMTPKAMATLHDEKKVRQALDDSLEWTPLTNKSFQESGVCNTDATKGSECEPQTVNSNTVKPV